MAKEQISKIQDYGNFEAIALWERMVAGEIPYDCETLKKLIPPILEAYQRSEREFLKMREQVENQAESYMRGFNDGQGKTK